MLVRLIPVCSGSRGGHEAMRWCGNYLIVAIGLAMAAACPGPARGDDIPRKYRPTVEKGLDWMRKAQNGDGSWSAASGQYAITMTALGGWSSCARGARCARGSTATRSARPPTS